MEMWLRTLARRLRRPAGGPRRTETPLAGPVTLRSLIETLPVIVYVDLPNEHSSSLYISPNVGRILGYPAEQWMADPELFPRILHPDDRGRVRAEQGAAPVGDEVVTEYRVFAADGRTVWIRDRYRLMPGPDGDVDVVHGVMEDVTALRAAESRFGEVLEHIHLLAVTLDRHGTILFANDHLLNVTGFTHEETTGRDWFDLFVPEAQRSVRRAAFLDVMVTGDLERHGECEILTASGGCRLVSFNHTLVRDDDGRPSQMTSIAEDITDRRATEEELHRLTHYDRLTGLPNRAHFSKWLDMAIECAASCARTVGVLFVSLDNFTLVNDSFGHAAGDELLRQFAARLREAASAAEVVARQGGDEFLVLLADNDPDTGAASTHAVAEDVGMMAGAIATRLRGLLDRPFAYDGHEVYLSASVGVSLYPQDAADGDALLRAALLDRYDARTFRPGPGHTSRGLAPAEELDLIAGLHRAIRDEEFHLLYQPVVDLATGQMTGAEALIRWTPPGGAPVPPDAFIPLAERTGLIAPITDWVVDGVCRQRLAWREQGIELDLAFNFPTSLWDSRTVSALLNTIRASGLRPGDLVLEITESTAMHDEDATDVITAMLRAAGLRLAIDDFGTGYSSLGRLRHLHASTIKVDRSFVRDVPGDPESAALVTTIVRLAANLGVRPLAEGIETEEQRRFLLELGCRHGQGYLFSRPVGPEEIARRRLAERRAA